MAERELSECTEVPKELLDQILELHAHYPPEDQFDHGFGLDLYLSMPVWLHIAPLVIKKVLEIVEASSGVQRGHMLQVALMPANVQFHEIMKERDLLAKRIIAAIRAGMPQYVRYLSESSVILRYWAIWGVRISDTPESRQLLSAHLEVETDADNRDAILSYIDSSWRPPAQSPPSDDIPF